MKTSSRFLMAMLVTAILLIAVFMVLAVIAETQHNVGQGIIAGLAFLVFSAPYFIVIVLLNRHRTGLACGIARGAAIFVILVSTPISLLMTIFSGFAGNQHDFISLLRMDGVWILFNLVNIPILVSSIRQLRRGNDRSSAGRGTAFAIGYGVAIFVGFQALFALSAPK